MVDSIDSFCWNPGSASRRLLPWLVESPPHSVPLPALALGVVVLMILVSFHRWIALLRAVYRNYQKRQVYKQWIARAHREREERQHRVLSLVAVADSDQDENIHNNHTPDWRTVSELCAAVQGGTATPAGLVIRAAHQCRRAREVYNCVAEELYDEAWEWAHQELLSLRPSSAKQSSDNDTNTNTKQQQQVEWPLLYGVPISVKECHAVKGCYSTGGLACRLNERCRHDCLMVQLVRDAGAVIVATGNVPQLMMLPCCENFLWGRTVNPYNVKRVPGGSSGGDAVLVATGAVPLAVGSDVAGSLRIPAAFCGIVAFKPTPGRCSYQGCMTPRFNNRPAGTTALLPVVMGPMARSVDDCATYMKVTLVPKLWETDRLLPPLPFDREQYDPQTTISSPSSSKSTRVLKLAYFDDDGWFEPCATSKRAVHETVKKLQQEGHLVERFELPTDGWYNYGLLVAINAAEGNLKSYVDALEGEPMIDDYTLLRRAANLPNWLRPMAAAVLDERRAHLLRQAVSGGVSARELLEKMVQLVEVRRQWASALHPYDAIIFPALPVPALPHGVSGELTAVWSYLFLGNLLQWPAGVVPVTTVQQHEVPYDVSQLPRNQQDLIARTVANRVCNADSVGLPMGVSVMSSAFRDETCLRVMREVERVVPTTTCGKSTNTIRCGRYCRCRILVSCATHKGLL